MGTGVGGGTARPMNPGGEGVFPAAGGPRGMLIHSSLVYGHLVQPFVPHALATPRSPRRARRPAPRGLRDEHGPPRPRPAPAPAGGDRGPGERRARRGPAPHRRRGLDGRALPLRRDDEERRGLLGLRAGDLCGRLRRRAHARHPDAGHRGPARRPRRPPRRGPRLLPNGPRPAPRRHLPRRRADAPRLVLQEPRPRGRLLPGLLPADVLAGAALPRRTAPSASRGPRLRRRRPAPRGACRARRGGARAPRPRRLDRPGAQRDRPLRLVTPVFSDAGLRRAPRWAYIGPPSPLPPG